MRYMNMERRDPVSALQLSLQNAKEFLKKLREFTERVDAIQANPKRLINKNPDEWEEVRIIRKALWIALIIEVGRLFDTYEKETKKVISFKSVFKNTNLEKTINKIHETAIVGKIINTRRTFTAHIAEQKNDIISAPEICNSNLGALLDKLDAPLSDFGPWS